MVSVIIPTLNEATHIEKTLDSVFSQEGNYEIIVSDGGSTDQTLDILDKYSGVKLIRASKGRACQMNEGAKYATGSVLLFLHADTLLMPTAMELIEKTVNDASVLAGSFYLKFDIDRPVYRFYSFCSKINHLLFTYGDQALFVRKEAFIGLNGFKNLALMEDVEIQKRLRKRGKFVKINLPVITSARRFAKHGALLQQVKNIAIVALFIIGVSANYLKKFYKD